MLRTAEFVPYVVFIEAPDFETLRAMNRAALESGVSTKQLTVRGSEVWWEGPDPGPGRGRLELVKKRRWERRPPEVSERENLTVSL